MSSQLRFWCQIKACFNYFWSWLCKWPFFCFKAPDNCAKSSLHVGNNNILWSITFYKLYKAWFSNTYKFGVIVKKLGLICKYIEKNNFKSKFFSRCILKMFLKIVFLLLQEFSVQSKMALDRIFLNNNKYDF